MITYEKFQNTKHVLTPAIVPSRWTAPLAGWVKLSTDGSWTEEGRAGASMILRDHLGNIIFSSCRELFSCRDALEAELCACMEGLSLAIQRTDLPIHIEMDSLSVVSIIKDEGLDRSVFASLVKEIKHLRSLRMSCVSHVSRSQNVASDFLAKFARVEGRTVVWLGFGPPELVELCNSDCNLDIT